MILLVARLTHADIAHAVHLLAQHELRQDPGDFVARRALVAAPHLGPQTATRLGILLAVYGGFKAAIVAGVLRGYRRAVVVGAMVFAVIATGGLVVLLLHPSVVRVGLGVLDILVAIVIALEARDLWRTRPVSAAASEARRRDGSSPR